MSNYSLTTQKNDLADVIANFNSQYKNIVLIGHSMGALPVIRNCSGKISKLVLWDPTTTKTNLER